jgi:hypothetical protein
MKKLFLSTLVAFLTISLPIRAADVEEPRIKGFKRTWVAPETNFKAYNVIFIEEVDTSNLEIDYDSPLDKKVTDEEVRNLAAALRDHFGKYLGNVIPVETSLMKLAGKQPLLIKLELTEIHPTNVAGNIASKAMIGFDFSRATLGVLGTIKDGLTDKTLVIFYDLHLPTPIDGNRSLLGSESFDKWKDAYETMDLWGDRLSDFLAKKRGQEYKSPKKFRLL